MSEAKIFLGVNLIFDDLDFCFLIEFILSQKKTMLKIKDAIAK